MASRAITQHRSECQIYFRRGNRGTAGRPLYCGRMAEPLKNQFGRDVPRRIGAQIAGVAPFFDARAFLRDVEHGYDALELMPRARHIAHTLRVHLPKPYVDALGILMASMGPAVPRAEKEGMAAFFYLPHVCFIAQFGLDDFEASMQAQYELTQRFTAEFSIRAYLEHHPAATLARLRQWATDDNVHVRRLVSEGSRPRLPWAPRLRAFQQNPRPVLELLELLKDDPELYVRRSVANNLNDIGKDHPDLLVATATQWLQGASDNRRWIVNHALRSAVKRADAGALATLGFGAAANVTVQDVRITPAKAHTGQSISVKLTLANRNDTEQSVLADLRVHFVKASGKTSAKTFKLRTVTLAPGESVTAAKTISLAQLTTRKHYPGVHAVDVLLNGKARRIGTFEIVAR